MFRKIEKRFQIESIGHHYDRIFSKDHDFKGERHDFIEIVYVQTGNVRIVENENVYILNGGDMVLHAPMEFHRIKSDAQTAPHVLNLSIITSGAFPEQLFDGVFHLSREQHESFMDCFRLAGRLLGGEGGDPYLGQQAADGLAVFLTELCREAAQGNDLSTDSSALLYRKLVKDMQDAAYRDLSLEELAKQNYISISYVKKLFRSYANVTPKRFYDDIRIKEAIILLKEDVPVAQIAERMNFSSPNFFAMFFKKHVGVTPSAFRKAQNSSR